MQRGQPAKGAEPICQSANNLLCSWGLKIIAAEIARDNFGLAHERQVFDLSKVWKQADEPAKLGIEGTVPREALGDEPAYLLEIGIGFRVGRVAPSFFKGRDCSHSVRSLCRPRRQGGRTRFQLIGGDLTGKGCYFVLHGATLKEDREKPKPDRLVGQHSPARRRALLSPSHSRNSFICGVISNAAGVLPPPPPTRYRSRNACHRNETRLQCRTTRWRL